MFISKFEGFDSNCMVRLCTCTSNNAVTSDYVAAFCGLCTLTDYDSYLLYEYYSLFIIYFTIR